jgi:DNA polymerase-3 subunit gamma/tau
MRLVASQPEREQAVLYEAPPAPVEETGPAIRSIADIAALADRHRDMALKVLLKRCVRPVRIESGRLEVTLTGEAPKTLLNDLSTRLQEWTGRRWVVSLSREQGGQTLAEMEAARRETAFMDARSDPAVAAILSRFPGARIIDVRIPDAAEEDETQPEPVPDPGIGDDDDDI